MSGAAGAASAPLDNQLREPLSAVLDRAPADWREVIEAWRSCSAGQELIDAVSARQDAGAVVYPAAVLRALEQTSRQAVRVVILGQDPYHGPGQAHGLSFSVPPGVDIPPSLLNIFKEIERDLGFARPRHGCLESWAKQGVLLLNAVLTVEAGQAGSHQGKGWEGFTDHVVETLDREKDGLVFMLWGSYAQAKGKIIDARRHCVLRAPHPSPLSAHRGFIGCGHFSAAS